MSLNTFNTYVAELIQVLITQFSGSYGGISPAPLPPGAVFPYITVSEITVREVESLQGLSGVTFTILQVNVWDKDFEGAGVMRDTIKQYMCSFSGTAGSRIIQGVNPVVDSMLHDGVRNLHQAVTRLQIAWAT